VIRVWAASTDYTKDVTIGPATLSAASTTLRKLRNTARFALGNLYDFDPAVDLVAHGELPQAERYLLHRLHTLSGELTAAYDELNFAKAQALLMTLANTELSSFYFEVVKSRLYCAAPGAPNRRAAQSALYHALDVLTKALAPIAPFCAEDIAHHRPLTFGSSPDGLSVFQDGWLAPPDAWRDPELEATWQLLLELRGSVMAALDVARKSKLIGSPLEARAELRLQAGSTMAAAVNSLPHEELVELLMVSACTVQVEQSCQDDCSVRVDVAHGSKCARCWHIVEAVDEESLCCKCTP
jgi:isoleucyl-tRNA synthetase